ncbi:MAG: IS1 family transposase [Desulfobacteraceae bacterium]|nr:IS1 family transposase [Desulfobacteraceae bacterium]
MQLRQRPARYPCPDTKCQLYGQCGKGNIIRYGFFRLTHGKRRRYRCKACGQTFCSTTGTPYHRIHRSRNTFDEVCSLSVEGVSKSAIAIVKKLSWNTVSRWLERAANVAKKFNEHRLRGFALQELQLDEIRTFLDRRERPIWIITGIEVWSRLWPSCVLGRRNYRNIRKLLRDLLSRSDLIDPILITTDGFEVYEWVIRRMFGPVCIYGQVIKTRRRNRVVAVDRKLLIGSRDQLGGALYRSEDSETLNTSFVERHNLTTRQGCSYLHRRTTDHARWPHRLEEHLELLRCHYNFIRSHMALKFGTIRRTPAMQARLTSRPLIFRQIFTSTILAVCMIWVQNWSVLTQQRKAA